MIEILEKYDKVQCPVCATKLKFAPSDIEIHYVTGESYIVCPVCEHNIYILNNVLNDE